MKQVRRSFKSWPAVLCAVAIFLSACQAQRGTLGDERTISAYGEEKATAEQARQGGERNVMKRIKIQIGEDVFTAELFENETAQAFADLLPLKMDMYELNGNEKYANLSQSLPENVQAVSGIQVGDLMLFGTDCVVLFYENFSTTYRYTPIGRIEDPEGLAQVLGAGSISVTFQAT